MKKRDAWMCIDGDILYSIYCYDPFALARTEIRSPLFQDAGIVGCSHCGWSKTSWHFQTVQSQKGL